MKSQKRRRLWPTPGCNAMEEEEEEDDQHYINITSSLAVVFSCASPPVLTEHILTSYNKKGNI
jgi:hypothetical protein